MEAVMRHSVTIMILTAALLCVPALPVQAQYVSPNGSTVTPLPPPPQPTPNPLPPSSYNLNSLNRPQPLDTHGDRTTRCLHYGATQGLTGGDLSAYSRACAND
jgi:hypothetical protein